jgi:hypothetical protein
VADAGDRRSSPRQRSPPEFAEALDAAAHSATICPSRCYVGYDRTGYVEQRRVPVDFAGECLMWPA